jgi:hypothetical protein
MAKRPRQHETFEYERQGNTHRGSFYVESGHLYLTTPHGSGHAALNIQSAEAIIESLLTTELGGKLVRTISTSN